MVTWEDVQETSEGIDSLSDDLLDREYEKFFESQPALCMFITEMTDDSEQSVQEMSLYLSFVMVRAVAMSRGAAPTVTPEMIRDAYQGSELWVARMADMQEKGLDQALAQTVQNAPEPFLLQFVLGELNDVEDEPLGDEEKGEIFFVLTTVISCLSENTQ